MEKRSGGVEVRVGWYGKASWKNWHMSKALKDGDN